MTEMETLDKKAELLRVEYLSGWKQIAFTPWSKLSESAKNNWRLLACGGYFGELTSMFDISVKNRNGHMKGYPNAYKKKPENPGVQP